MDRKRQKITDHLNNLEKATSKLMDSGILDEIGEISDVGDLFHAVKGIGSQLGKSGSGFKFSDLGKMLFEEDGMGEKKTASGPTADPSNPWSSRPQKSHRWVNTEATEEDGESDWENDYSCYEEIPAQLAGDNSDHSTSDIGSQSQKPEGRSDTAGRRKNGQEKLSGSGGDERAAFEVYHRKHPLSGTKAGKSNRVSAQTAGSVGSGSGTYPNLEEIIVWSEIIGDPVSVKRRKQRNERRYGYQGYAGRR